MPCQSSFQDSTINELSSDGYVPALYHLAPVASKRIKTRSGSLVCYDYTSGLASNTFNTNDVSQPSTSNSQRKPHGSKWELLKGKWCYDSVSTRTINEGGSLGPKPGDLAVASSNFQNPGIISVQFRVPPTQPTTGQTSPKETSRNTGESKYNILLPEETNDDLSKIDVEALLEKKQLSKAACDNISCRLEGIQSRQVSLERRFPDSVAVVRHGVANLERIIPLTETLEEHKAIMNEVDDILKRLGKQKTLQARTGVPAIRNDGFEDNTAFQRDGRFHCNERFQHFEGQRNGGFFKSKGFSSNPTYTGITGPNHNTVVYNDAGHQGGANRNFNNEHHRNVGSQRNTSPYWNFEDYKSRKCRDWVWRADGKVQGVRVYGDDGMNGGGMHYGATPNMYDLTHYEEAPYRGNVQHREAVPYQPAMEQFMGLVHGGMGYARGWYDGPTEFQEQNGQHGIIGHHWRRR